MGSAVWREDTDRAQALAELREKIEPLREELRSTRENLREAKRVLRALGPAHVGGGGARALPEDPVFYAEELLALPDEDGGGASSCYPQSAVAQRSRSACYSVDKSQYMYAHNACRS